MSGTAASPDAAVRAATGADAAAVSAVQLRAWRASYAGTALEALLDDLSADIVAAAWHSAVERPPGPAHRVVVATAADIVTGFAALAPSGDPDGGPGDAEVVALEVDPVHRGAGHGSRLLNAAADTARELGFDRLSLWVPEADRERAGFATAAGMAADGARRVRAAGDDVDETRSTAGGTTGRRGEWAEVRLVSGL